MRWIPRPAEPADITQLSQELRIPSLIARLLVARGIREPEQAAAFLSPSLTHMHSPYAMLGMKVAVERLRVAIERKEPVLIYGDYDVDGTTAIVILKTAIELCGGAADFHVPHRIRDGYGMKDDVIEGAAGAGVRLIISVDTGIRAFAAAETARRLGVDLIVTDHHLPEAHQGTPRALAVLNPNQPGCEYPCKALCGAGVAFKLAQALLEGSGRERLLPSFLKVVAIATIADAVELTGENRVFTKLGLEGLRKPVNLGLKALLEVAALDNSRPLNVGDVAFRLAPRLNAAGRMDVARDVIDLFSTRDPEEVRRIAVRLNQLNSDRQQEEARIMAEVEGLLEGSPAMRDAFCIVVDGDAWHRGVIGIAATRVVERYGRPALVVSREGGEAYGSGRSIPAFHLLDALESCRDMFTRFGGHAHAVGFSLPAARVCELRSTLDRYARSKLTAADFEPLLEFDAELPLGRITPELYRQLERLEPFGMGNPGPVFVAYGVNVTDPPRWLKEKHVRLRLKQDGEREHKSPPSWQAVGWRLAEQVQTASILAGDVVDIAFTIEHNSQFEFGGLELRLEDVVKAQSAVATRPASARA